MAVKFNRTVLFVIIAIIVVAAAVVLAYVTILKPKEVIAFAGEPLEIRVQPEGDLQHIPGEMVFHFSQTFPGVQGAVIEEDSLPNFITITPPLEAYGRWITENTFELYFRTSPQPDRKYEVILKRVPLLTEPEPIPPQKYTFTTPPFTLLNASLKSVENKVAVLVLDFNFAPVMSEVRKHLEIYDSRLNRVEIMDIRVKRDQPWTLDVVVPVAKAPEQYKVIVTKGLKSTRDVELKKSVTNVIAIGFTTGPITVRGHRVEESEEGYMVLFDMASTAERRMEIKEERLSDFVRIKPEISFRVASANNQLYIFAELIPEKKYEVTLKSGIRSKQGSILHDDYTAEIAVPKRRETFQFLYQGRYFGRTGDWKLPLKVAQICTLRVSITYMQPQNVLFWHLKDYGIKERMFSLGETVVRDLLIPLEKGTKEQIVWINLKDHIPDFAAGVYLIEARGKSENRRHFYDKIAVVISDIALVVKWYDKNTYVWAFNASTLSPEPGVAIEVRSSKNFLTGTGTTDNGGYCHIKALREDRDPYIVFAKKGDDWTYAHTQSLRLQSESYDISGEMPSIPYLAFLYPERDLYRPGEEVHFGVVLRERYSFKGLALPIRIKVRDPKGKDYLSLSGQTDANGICEFSFPTSPSSPTGKYMLELIAGDRVLYTGHVFVETFVPERMRVQASLPDKFDLGKPFSLAIESEYLFGAPAAGERYQVIVSVEETQFRCPSYYNYTFGKYQFWQAKIPSWRSAEIKGSLDQQGKASVVIQPDTTVEFQGPAALSAYVTVTEGGSGRVTAKTLRQTVHTRPFYIGLKSSASRVSTNIPIEIKGILMNPDCSAYTGKPRLTYKVYRLSYSYNYRYYDDYYWDSRIMKIPVTVAKEIAVTDGKFSFSFTPTTRRNDYFVEVIDENSGTITEIRIAGWGWWYGDEDKIDSPEVIPLRLDKNEYDVNEQVTVEALLPFEGNILWTVELDTIYTTQWTQAKGEIATWTFKAPRGVSTVYVSALLVRSGGNYLVQRGFGIERVRIRPSAQKLGFNIDVPQRIRPGDELVIKIKGSHKFKGTIAVVDEGILQITDFRTPDPYEKILRDMRLSINSAESFGWIVKKFLDQAGGGVAEREKEFPEARFARIVSYWSGIMESGSDGRLVYKLKIPEYNGKLRVMVLGLNEQRFGAAEANVVVKSDVIVSPTIPRFMYTEDDFTFPITLINTTEKNKTANVSVVLKGGDIKSDSKFSVKLSRGEKKIVWINCRAGGEPGSLDLAIDGSADNERYHEDFVIPLYPNVPFITESEYVTVDARTKMNLKRHFEDWYPRAHTAQLMLSDIPALARLNHVRFAVRYPYGCIEQTSTSTLVLLRLSPLLPVIAPKITRAEYTDMVNHGVRRLIAMQTVSGGFSFWPGDYDPQPWASAYAIFVLLEAKKAGFVVPESVVKASLNYLDALPQKSGFVYYVLARGGTLQKQPEMVDRLITLGKKEEYDASNALWVAGAVHESGKATEALHLLDIALKKQPPKTRRHHDDFYSPLQLLGMRFYMTQLINPESPVINDQIIALATSLAGRLSYYYTTQELAWTMLSLGMYAEKKGLSDIKATLKLDGKEVKPHREKGLVSWTLNNVAKYNSVVLEIASDAQLFLNIENTGFSRTRRAFERYAKGMTVWRTFYNYSGKPVSSIEQGDLVVMEIGMKADGHYQNVAVEGSIPAGLEIENPRLGRDDLPSWVAEQERKRRRSRLWNPDYVDIKDDRVMIFGSVYGDTLYYYTLTRAVTPGTYFLPPTTSIVMYNPELNARSDVGDFKVIKR